jgi:hypothetical protein
MKKILPLLLLFTVSYFYSFAQSAMGTRVSIGPEIGIPLGDANQIYSLTEGASLKIEIPITSRGLDFTITAGYTVFKVNDNYNGYINNAQYIPIEVGIKRYFSYSPVFVEIAAGVSINNNNNYTTNKAAFIYAPALGVSVANNALDISVRDESRVESSGTIGQFALRVAYKFGGK